MLNIEKVNSFSSAREETVDVDLGTYGTIKLRTSIGLNAQEAFIDFVCNNVFDGISFYPARKEPLIATAFVQAFVVDESDRGALLRTEEDDFDIYMVYKLAEEIGLSSEIHNITLGLLQMIDAKIQHLIDRANSDLAGGAANVVMQTVEDMNSFINSASELIAVLKEAISQNSKKLSAVLTKKNITTFLDTLSSKLEAAVSENVKQAPYKFTGDNN